MESNAEESTTEPAATPELARSSLPPPGEKRRIDLHRRRAIVTAERIDVRPSRAAIVPPLAGFTFGAGCVGLIVLGVTSNAIPYWLLAILLLLALITVPLAGITLVYALFGANVIFDRAKQSATWQQGLLGMGIGTTELVPFWKIEAILVTEAGAPGSAAGSRTEEFAQWQVALHKTSGTTLAVAGMTVPRRFASFGLAPVQALADAIGALVQAPVRREYPEAPEEFLPAESTGAQTDGETHGPRHVQKRPAQPPRRRSGEKTPAQRPPG